MGEEEFPLDIAARVEGRNVVIQNWKEITLKQYVDFEQFLEKAFSVKTKPRLAVVRELNAKPESK